MTFTDGFGAGDVALNLADVFARHFGCGCGEAFGLGACATKLTCKLRCDNLSYLSFILPPVVH